MNEVITAITTVGFPIVACLLVGWYVKKQTDNYRTDIATMQQEHKDEIYKLTEVLQNNTLAIQKLCDKLDKEDTAA